eukprot:TRINITY_DN80759_c0_g1_i1.p1 TRINITY_DN80759_c0_g1~~TRINITY_DN80759_c0_g1_i1.p1  ORF type:complete len:647 (-),score=98.99 TRINITY_DN80759_c0_g1_i1:552-2492(-)
MAFAAGQVRNQSIPELLESLQHHKLSELETALTMLGPKGRVSLDTLPLTGPVPNQSRLRAICDVISDPPELNLQEVARLLRAGNMDALPPILQPRIQPGIDVKMQLVIVPDETDTVGVQIFKHFSWDSDTQLPGRTAKELCHGTPKTVKWLSANPIPTKKVLQWMLEGMGGLRFLWWRTELQQQDDAIQALDAGYDFILNSDVIEMTPYDQLRWTNVHIKTPTCAIYNWKERQVKNAIEALQKQGSLAKVRKDYVLTMLCLDQHFLRFGLFPILPTLKNHGLLLLGQANAGKTPLSIIVSLMFSRHYIQKFAMEKDSSMRTAPDLDFFRGNPGNISCPFVFDDSDIDQVNVAKLKAFLDVGEEEAMTRERWGASKFVMNQLRIAIDNKYDEEKVNPNFPEDAVEQEVAMQDLIAIIKPAFVNVAAPDLDAILKRASLIVNTKQFFYVKLAEVPTVKRYRMPRLRNGLATLLTPQAGALLKSYKQDGVGPDPQKHLNDLHSEQKLLSRILSGRDPEPDIPEPGVFPVHVLPIANGHAEEPHAEEPPPSAAPSSPLFFSSQTESQCLGSNTPTESQLFGSNTPSPPRPVAASSNRKGKFKKLLGPPSSRTPIKISDSDPRSPPKRKFGQSSGSSGNRVIVNLVSDPNS